MKKILILAALLSASLAYGQRTEGLDPLSSMSTGAKSGR